MADPVGLISLGLTGVGKATSTVRLRKKRKKIVRTLAAHVDAADLKLRDAGGDIESYRAVLSPIIDEAAALLHRFAAKKRLDALSDAMDDGSEDVDNAKQLIDAFKAADAAIEIHRTLRRIRNGVGEGNDAVLELQRHVARLERIIHICIASVCFFRGGESGVTPYKAQKLREVVNIY